MILSEQNIEREINFLKKEQRKIRNDKGVKRDSYSQYRNKQFITYLRRANAKGFVFDLQESDFEVLHELACNYCGDNATGYDRVNSKLGYLKTNIVPACSSCNMMKNAVNVNDFISKIKQIHSYLNL